MIKDIIELYEENEKLALQSSLFRRKTLLKNEKRHENMGKELDKEIKGDKAGSAVVERLIRNMKNLEEMINQQRKEITDIDEQYKKLISMLKERHPEELERVKSNLIRKLTMRGEFSK
jgi:hypothetical protein